MGDLIRSHSPGNSTMDVRAEETVGDMAELAREVEVALCGAVGGKSFTYKRARNVSDFLWSQF